MNTLYWHDYETWGINPAIDRPSQFAGMRTDEELNVIGEPLLIYCRPPDDILPHPEACLVTGQTPQHIRDHGVGEAEFIARIEREFSRAGTCALGYNSLRFDDEVTRYSLYRNYFDPYEREWRNGNSRWDIIDMTRLVYALRPDGIEWPQQDGRPSFRLENLTAANGISHGAAHDALADVEATIQFARLLRTKKPDLYHYIYTHRSKQAAAAMIDIRARKPVLHISSRFAAEQGCAALVVPLALHATNKNSVIAFDLSAPPDALEQLSAEDIAARVFTATDDLPDGQARIPLKQIHLNKCPILLPARMLDEKVAKRLGIDRERCERHWQKILKMELEFKVREVFAQQTWPSRTDPEQRLYEGFCNDSDKNLMRTLRREGFGQGEYYFDDERLNGLLLPYKARNYPQALSATERAEWREHCARRLRYGEEGIQSLAQFRQRVADLQSRAGLSERDRGLLTSLMQYGDALAQRFLGESTC